MKLWLLAVLCASALLFGCFGYSAPAAPPYQPPYQQPAPVTPSQASNSSITSQNETAPTPPVITPQPIVPVVNESAPNETVVDNTSMNSSDNGIGTINSTTPAENASGNNTSAPTTICGGSGSTDQLDCISAAAISQKDVVICTQLVTLDARNMCFNRWCSSAARDYNKCQALTNNDDRLGCLNRCNPNFNS